MRLKQSTLRSALLLWSLALCCLWGAQACSGTDQRDLPPESPDFTITMAQLAQEVAAENGEQAAQEKYKGKAVQLEGVVAEVDGTFEDETILMLTDPKEEIQAECRFNDDYAAPAKAINTNERITAICECRGIEILPEFTKCKLVGEEAEE